jgi:hypothetical protein
MKLSDLKPLDQAVEEHRQDPEFRAWDRIAFARDGRQDMPRVGAVRLTISERYCTSDNLVSC